jgi:hypothetical protein
MEQLKLYGLATIVLAFGIAMGLAIWKLIATTL